MMATTRPPVASNASKVLRRIVVSFHSPKPVGLVSCVERRAETRLFTGVERPADAARRPVLAAARPERVPGW
jgi:hypothetical protein